MNFIDAAAVEHPRVTADGYLVADARIVRTGIQIYAGFEVGKPDMETVRVYRPEAEVFHKDSLASFSHIPVTDDHPKEAVTAANWKDLAVGETSDEVLRDGHRLRIPLIVKDAAAIAKVQSGKRELSAGYSCDLSFEDGTTPQGEAYDAVQRNIRANHLAIVQRGRAGTEFRIGDGAAEAGNRTTWGASPILTTDKETPMTLKTVTVDGIPIEVTDQGATVIATLQNRLSDSAANLTKLTTDHAAALAAKDADLAKRDATIDDLKTKVVTDADLDKRVQDRADLISAAAIIAKDVKTVGLSDADIRKTVVIAKRGDAMKDKSQAYFDAAFDILVEDAAKDSKADPLRNVVIDGVKDSTDLRTQAAQAHHDRNQSLRDAWKTPSSAAAN